MSLGAGGIGLHRGTLAGNERTRGRAVLAGDGKTQEFAVVFPAPFAAAPFVVASADAPLGLWVRDVTADLFTAAFAQAPAADAKVTVTWMAQE